MPINARLVAAMFAGFLCVVGALTLQGARASDLISTPSLFIVLGTAIGGLIVLRGPRIAGLVLKAAVVKHVGDKASREELIDSMEVLERTSLLGGFLGLMAGVVGAIAAFNEPTSIGPNLALAFTSLFCCLFLNVFVALPLKQQLLQEVGPSMQLTPRAAVLRTLPILSIVVLALLAISMWPHSDSNLAMFVSAPGILFMLAVLGPSAITARDPVLTSPVSERRQLWFSNAMVCGGVIALCCGLMHVCSVLDQPALLPQGVAWAIATSVMPIAGAIFMRLQSPHEELRVSQPEHSASRNLYFGFAGFAAASLLCLMALVFLCVHNLDGANAAAPR